MHPSRQAARASEARQRIVNAAGTLAERYGLAEQAEAVRAAGHRDAGLDALFKSEAVADLLEALCAVPEPDAAAEASPEPEPAAKPTKSTRKR